MIKPRTASRSKAGTMATMPMMSAAIEFEIEQDPAAEIRPIGLKGAAPFAPTHLLHGPHARCDYAAYDDRNAEDLYDRGNPMQCMQYDGLSVHARTSSEVSISAPCLLGAFRSHDRAQMVLQLRSAAQDFAQSRSRAYRSSSTRTDSRQQQS